MMNNKIIEKVAHGDGMKKSKLFSVIVALFLITSVYLLPFSVSISIGELSLIICMIGLILFEKKTRIYSDISIWIFAIYAVIITLIAPLLYGVSLTDGCIRLMRDAFYFILIYVFGITFLDYRALITWIKIICSLLSLLIIIQFVAYLVSGRLIVGIIPGAIVSGDDTLSDIYQHALYMANLTGYLKAMGFLQEGAHCGQALAIGIVITFNFVDPSKNTKKDYIMILLFSIATVLTFSAMGYVLVLTAWMCIVWSFVQSGLTGKRLGLITILILFGMIFFIFVPGDSSFSSVIHRITSASRVDSADSSSFYRIYKGFDFWGKLPIENKLFGIGFGNYKNLSFLASISRSEYLISEYMNSVAYFMVSGGLFGFCIYSIHIIKIFINGNLTARVMTIILLLMSIAASPYSSVYWVWMMLVILFNTRTN